MAELRIRELTDRTVQDTDRFAIDPAAPSATLTGSTTFADLITAISGNLKKTFTIGNTVATSFVLTHSLGTRNVIVEISEAASPYAKIETDWEATSTDTITVSFISAPSTNEYTVTIQ